MGWNTEMTICIIHTFGVFCLNYLYFRNKHLFCTNYLTNCYNFQWYFMWLIAIIMHSFKFKIFVVIPMESFNLLSYILLANQILNALRQSKTYMWYRGKIKGKLHFTSNVFFFNLTESQSCLDLQRQLNISLYLSLI